jgi:hypothetical protein
MAGRLRRAALAALLAVALAAGHLAVVWDATRGRPVDWDEFGWLVASDAAFRLLFVERTRDARAWHEGIQLTTYGAMNPNFAKLVMGTALRARGYELAAPPFFPLLGPPNVRYDSLRPEQRRLLAREHLPYVRELRWLVLYTSAACAVALFFLGRALAGPLVGFAAYAGFALTPLVERLSFSVYSDMLLLLMLLLSALATVAVLRGWARPESSGAPLRSTAAFCGVGVLLGLTVGTKYNGALASVAFGACALYLWGAGRFRHHPAWHTAAALAGTAAVAFAVFFAHNPQLQGNVPARVAESARAWSELIAFQQVEFRDDALTSPGAKLAAVVREAVLGSGVFARALPVAGALLVAAGLVLAAVRWSAARRAHGDLVGPTVLLVWPAVLGAGTTLWLPMDWARYFLPVVPALCLLQALPLDAAWRGARAWARGGGASAPSPQR